VDYAGAHVAYITARAAGAKDVEFRDFLPDWSGQGREESDDVLLQKLQAFASKHRKEG
jgi:hypothetical protein